MKKTSRRGFLKIGALGGMGLLLAKATWPAGAAAESPAGGVCVTLCNHWSYIGIGWQLGIESNVLSVVDAMEMADRPPHVKTCINLDARAYEFMAEKFPEVAERLKKYLAAGQVELIGGSYAQPMGTTVSGESNIRQIVCGREIIRKVLDYEMVTFLEEEEYTHPQIPQIVAGAGFRYAGLAQLDTWGRAGIPVLELNAVRWKGLDGTTILSVPKTPLFGYAPDLKQLTALPAFGKLAAQGKPLIFTWEEFGWESPEQPSYLTAPAKYKQFAEQSPVEFVTVQQYLDKYGGGQVETVYLPMDAWNKSLTWGLGGDQVRILDRKVEGLLVAAERFDAVASAFGMQSRARELDKAWRDLMTAQSHDVGLCEYSRWQGARLAPHDRIEDYHSFTWGTIGYNHLDAAQKQGQAIVDAALGYLAGKINTQAGGPGGLVVTAFNPSGWQRTDLVQTGRIYPLPDQAKGVVVKDRSGKPVPSQIMKAERDAAGNLVVADIALLAANVPAVGYDTYRLEFGVETSPPESPLRVDEANLILENEQLRVRLNATGGGIASLIDKRSGREMLDTTQGAFPAFKGRPNPNLSLRPNAPAFYDSTKSKGQLTWLAKGPLRATLRAQHSWPYLTFETHVSLAAGVPYVEVLTRLLALVPPHSDASAPDIKEGYWISLTPTFEPVSVLRDFPFGVEPTQKPAFHALTFVDLVGKDAGLLVLHPGTQYFRREQKNGFANLLMREWESHFTREYGWPIYAEYRHGLLPHAAEFSHAARLQAAGAFCQPLLPAVGRPRSGDLPAAKGFVQVLPDHVLLSAFRKKTAEAFELRVVEVQGRQGSAAVTVELPLTSVAETDLLGRKTAAIARRGNQLTFPIEPWKIRTFELDV